jgi:hypothetical protein
VLADIEDTSKLENMKALTIAAAMLLVGAITIPAASWTASDTATEYGTKADPLSSEDLIRVALGFSGVTAGRVDSYLARIERGIGEFRATNPSTDVLVQGEELLAFLHERYFVEYSEPQTLLDTVLDRGTYNCVSSAVLYIVFAVELGIPVSGVSTSDHAFCAVGVPGNRVDVETTSEHGFDPGSKKEFTDSFGRTGFSYVPPGNYRDRQDRSIREMVAFILQNRMSELERDNRFDLALPLAIDHYAFVGTDESRHNLYRAAANYASQLNERLDYDGAMAFLEGFQGVHGEDEALDGIESISVYNAVVEFSNAGDYVTARDLLDDPRLDARSRSQLTGLVVGNAAIEATADMNLDESISYLDREKDLLDRSIYRDILVSKAGQEANGLASRGAYLEAATLLEGVNELVGGDSRLREGMRVFLDNYAITVHNEFVPLFNAGEYEAARDLVEAGLRIVPGNRLLLQDLRLLDE